VTPDQPSPVTAAGRASSSPSFQQLLHDASDTRAVVLERGGYAACGAAFAQLFPGSTAVLVSDATTRRVAGAAVRASLLAAGVAISADHVIAGPDISASWEQMVALEALLGASSAIPVAIGSGTINDLVKLAAHRQDRSYLVAATAASMDGYAAFGASITRDGSKLTISCPAPRAVIADLEVVAQAPSAMTAAGYADLLAKVVAGADWILADALGVEALQPRAWQLAQEGLRQLLGEPRRLAAREPEAFADLMAGLVRSGLAMQSARSSRPASGAEHQFSHLWDMQGPGLAFPHGFKVGIGTLASAALYEQLLAEDITAWDVAGMVRSRASRVLDAGALQALHGAGPVLATALSESAAKPGTSANWRMRLERLVHHWPQVHQRLRAQLLPAATLRSRLQEIGAPVDPTDIGLTLEALRRSHRQAMTIRRRFTILDLAEESGLLETWLRRLFSAGGYWGDSGN
jgi:glycerol-1-phosphate dehydrogenase [NAD(P)+]